MNRKVEVNASQLRIVSLVPSQTQLLHFLGLEQEVVGITKFCISPDSWYRNKKRVGGTKSVDLEKVRELSPTLIIGNKEENSEADIVALEQVAPVWMSDIETLKDAFDMILSISEITGKRIEGEELVRKCKVNFDALKQSEAYTQMKGRSAVYFIWNDPNMAAGNQTFIDEMISLCGLENAVIQERYPEVNELECDPDFVFLSSEPYPFKEDHISRYQKLFPSSKVKLVDGEMFSWYGSKMKDAPIYFEGLLKELVAH
jgi:ABC-type Fe3+-hydroxamate transport system substrate-binding protein